MKKSSKHYKPHVVDEATETVYLTVNSLSGAMVAPFWVNKHYPDYRCVIVKEIVTKLIKDEF